MTPEHWTRIKHILELVLEREDSGEPADVAVLCAEHPELETEVARLLSQYRKISGFLERPAAELIRGSEPVFEIGQLAGGRYEVVHLLGAGGMGEVWEARDMDLRGKRVAIKVLRSYVALNARVARRMAEEVLLAREVIHPNVCPIYDISSTETRSGAVPFLVMKLIEGESLKERIQRDGPFGLTEALRLAGGIAEGLDAAHRAGVIHRDLKPGNVMLQQGAHSPQAVVTDFGLATSFRGRDSVFQQTASHILAGTPDYMAPEQRVASASVSPQCDIYSFGLVIYEMITGRLPAAAGLDTDALPRGWPAVLARCLAEDPESRFNTAGEVVASLRRASEVRRWRKFLLVAAAGLAITAVAVSGGYRRIRRFFSPLPAARHVAVLSFSNLSGEPEWNPVAASLTETVAAELARAQRPGVDFWVQPNSDVAAQQVTTARKARQIFGVNLVIQGVLERQGGTARFRMEVRDPADDRKLQAREFLTPSSELFRLSGQVAAEAARMLDIPYEPDVETAYTPKTAAAYRLYEAAVAAIRTQDAQNMANAISLLSQALDKEPAYALAYAKLAQAYAARWNHTHESELMNLANRSIERAAALNLNPLILHYTGASVANTFRKHELALEEARRCLALDPTYADCLLYLAGSYDGLDRMAEAEKAFRKAIDLRPHNWMMYNRLGSFYFRHARYLESEKMFRSAIETAPWNAVGYNNLAGIYLSTRRYAEAAGLLETANRIRPSATGLTNLGNCYFYLGRYDAAAVEYENATKLEPRRPELWCNLGDAYARIPGNAAKAASCYRRAIDLITERNLTAPARESLAAEALYRAKLGDRPGARRALDQARITSADPRLRFSEAIVRELIGERPVALRALREALAAGVSREELEQAPELEKLRKDPQYSNLGSKQ